MTPKTWLEKKYGMHMKLVKSLFDGVRGDNMKKKYKQFQMVFHTDKCTKYDKETCKLVSGVMGTAKRLITHYYGAWPPKAPGPSRFLEECVTLLFKGRPNPETEYEEFLKFQEADEFLNNFQNNLFGLVGKNANNPKDDFIYSRTQLESEFGREDRGGRRSWWQFFYRQK